MGAFPRAERRCRVYELAKARSGQASHAAATSRPGRLDRRRRPSPSIPPRKRPACVGRANHGNEQTMFTREVSTWPRGSADRVCGDASNVVAPPQGTPRLPGVGIKGVTALVRCAPASIAENSAHLPIRLPTHAALAGLGMRRNGDNNGSHRNPYARSAGKFDDSG